jgi:hypothetical protein
MVQSNHLLPRELHRRHTKVVAPSICDNGAFVLDVACSANPPLNVASQIPEGGADSGPKVRGCVCVCVEREREREREKKRKKERERERERDRQRENLSSTNGSTIFRVQMHTLT